MGVYKVKGKGKEETWYIDFYVDGRRVRKAVGNNKKDAENALTALKADILRGEFRFRKDQRIKFENFANGEYLSYIKINKKSWKRNVSSLSSLIPHLKGINLSKISPKNIEEYKKKRIEQGINPRTVNRDMLCLNHVFNIAKKLGCFDGENPVKEVQYFPERPGDMRILSEEEINLLINATDGHLRSIITVALNTGMRKGEILNLRWSDIDFMDSFIYVRQTKSGYMRKIPMNDVVRETLKKTKIESEYVFSNPKTNGPITNVTKPFSKVREKIGIPELRFHDLRHSFATIAVQKGIDLVTVKEILGHFDITMTVRYCHPTPENKRRAVDVLASIFKEKREDMDINRSYDQKRPAPKHAVSHSFSRN